MFGAARRSLMLHSRIIEYIWREGTRVWLSCWKLISIKQRLPKALSVFVTSMTTWCSPAYPSLLSLTCSLNTVSGFDYIGFETDRAGRAMQLEEKAAGIAQYGTHLVATP